jgi:hypothetical protein
MLEEVASRRQVHFSGCPKETAKVVVTSFFDY